MKSEFIGKLADRLDERGKTDEAGFLRSMNGAGEDNGLAGIVEEFFQQEQVDLSGEISVPLKVTLPPQTVAVKLPGAEEPVEVQVTIPPLEVNLATNFGDALLGKIVKAILAVGGTTIGLGLGGS